MFGKLAVTSHFTNRVKSLVICRCFCSAIARSIGIGRNLGGLSSGPQPAEFNIRNSGAGTYKIRYPPVSSDPQHLRMMVRGVDIPRSVFSIPTCPATFS